MQSLFDPTGKNPPRKNRRVPDVFGPAFKDLSKLGDRDGCAVFYPVLLDTRGVFSVLRVETNGDELSRFGVRTSFPPQVQLRVSCSQRSQNYWPPEKFDFSFYIYIYELNLINYKSLYLF